MKRSLCLHHGLFCCSFIINCFRLLGMRQRIFQVDNQKDTLNLQCTHAEVCYSVFFWKLPHPYQDREGLKTSTWLKSRIYFWQYSLCSYIMFIKSSKINQSYFNLYSNKGANEYFVTSKFVSLLYITGNS